MDVYHFRNFEMLDPDAGELRGGHELVVEGDRIKEVSARPGMTFSNEPTICIYGEFGVRLEDHMVITETGARWFTQPAHTVDDPFGLEK
jgi:Xaa-Pro dipeptidase